MCGFWMGTGWESILFFFSKIFKKKSLTKEAKEQLIGVKEYNYDDMMKIFHDYGISSYPEIIKQVYGEANYKKFEKEWDEKRKSDTARDIKNAVKKLRNG
jgi:hypothetical protein